MLGTKPDYLKASESRGGQVYKSSDKPRFVPKGHDAILKRHQDSKKVVVITLVTGKKVTGTVVARDKYTITLLVRHEKMTSEYYERTVYKHAIVMFNEAEAE